MQNERENFIFYYTDTFIHITLHNRQIFSLLMCYTKQFDIHGICSFPIYFYSVTETLHFLSNPRK